MAQALDFCYHRVLSLIFEKFMKKQFILTAVMASVLALTACNSDGSASKAKAISEASTDVEKVGYSLGYLTGKSSKDEIPDLDIKAFEQGLKDGRATDEKAKPALTEEQMQKVLTDYQKKREEDMVKEIEAKAKTNKEAGEKFLAENANKEGVVKTASGLQYKVITEGSGPKPKATDVVTVHYEGKLIDGKVFDSSYERGEPVQFPLNQVIKGWTEGVQLMSPGSKYEFFIPSDLAYGEAGNPAIEPNSVLIFTVELLGEEAAKKASADAKAKTEAQLAELQKMAQQQGDKPAQ